MSVTALCIVSEPSALSRARAAGFPPEGAEYARTHAVANEPVALSLTARLILPFAPANGICSALIRFFEVFARIRPVVLGVGFGVVAQAEFDGVEIQLMGHLVHRRF